MANDDSKFEHKYLDVWAKSASPPSYFVDRHPTAVECVRCKELEHIGPCPNCGSSTYKAGYDSQGVAGLFCTKCNKGRTRWTCGKCGTDNAMANTFGQLYPKAFVSSQLPPLRVSMPRRWFSYVSFAMKF